MFNKIFSIILLLSSISWFISFIEVLTGTTDFSPFTLATAFFVTGGLTFILAIGVWRE